MRLRNSTIKPYSTVESVSQTSCKHFFRCTPEDSAAGLLKDSIGGVTWTPVIDGFTLSYDSSLKAFSTNLLSGTAAPALTSGSFNTWGANSAAMVIMAGRIVDGTELRFSLGSNVVGDGLRSFGMTTAGTFHAVIGALDGSVYNRLSNVGSIGTANNGDDVVFTMHYLPGSGITRFELYNITNSSTYIINATSSDGTQVGTGVSPFQPNAYMRFSGIKVYGAAYHEFTSGNIPADWKSAIFWCGVNWKNGDRFLYPAWNGIT